ncbi:C40 family peptidase [Flavobacterium sp. W20_MBD1_R3]|uniref:C40 family peptidase n=1 Tax=Flavobacterium sp. W20_MBD1_R3 TaxID=3240278 RepID=UPI003F8EC63D
MKFKSMSAVKLTLFIGLLLLVLGSIAYGSSKAGGFSSQKNEIIVKDTLVDLIDDDTYLGDKIVNFGMGLLGTPYVAAGCSKNGFDCSGFVYYVYNHFKIKVPRSSSQFKNFGKEIQIANVKKGDILLFLSPTRNIIGHIGIVSNPKGMDSDFIHSTSGREMKVIITSLKKPGYTRRFVKAIRVL